jgi:hypothetical protein
MPSGSEKSRYLESIFIALEEYERNIAEDGKAALYVKLMDRIVHHHSS